MAHDDAPKSLVFPTGSRHPRILLALAVAALVAIAAAILLAKSVLSSADASSLLPSDAIGAVGPLSIIDHSVVETKVLVDEPDMTGASIGAYRH